MSETGFTLVENGIRLAETRAAILATDAANARTPGFVPYDVTPELVPSDAGLTFAAAVRQASSSGETGTLEFAMSATAENSVRFKALADQERAMLREFRTVAEESRR